MIVLIFFLVFLTSLFLGRYKVDLTDLSNDRLGRKIITEVRLPRLLTAALLGAALSIAGAALQYAFKNPLVSPGILGVTQGSAFGAAIAILLFSAVPLAMEISATLFGLLAFFLVYVMAGAIRYGGRVLRLVLGGIAVSALFSGGVGVMKYLADPMEQLPEITFWLLGGLSGALWGDLLYALPLAVGGITLLLIIRWRVNLLTLSDDVARSVGSDPKKLRLLVIVAAVSATAAVTSVAGVVVWIGLIVPHIARKIVGVDTKKVLPASALLGGTLMIISTTLPEPYLPERYPWA